MSTEIFSTNACEAFNNLNLLFITKPVRFSTTEDITQEERKEETTVVFDATHRATRNARSCCTVIFCSD